MPVPSVRPVLPSTLPAGWVAREPSVDDAPAAFDLLAACDTAVLGVPDVALGDVVADIGLDPQGQTIVLDGSRVRAWAWLLDKAPGRTMVDVYVDPELPPDLGDRLAAWCWSLQLARCAELAVARGVESTTAEVGSLDADAVTEKRLRATGFEQARTFWRMVRPARAADRDVTPAPGVVVRSVTEADLPGIYELLEAAFADHWGHTRRSYDDWWRNLSTTYGFDLDLWWVAEVEGRPAGALIATGQMGEEDAIYVSTLGTLAEFRGRGVATSLLGRAFVAGVERGWSLAKLNVDSESSTSAPALYSGVGMNVDFAMHAWQLEVPARVRARRGPDPSHRG